MSSIRSVAVAVRKGKETRRRDRATHCGRIVSTCAFPVAPEGRAAFSPMSETLLSLAPPAMPEARSSQRSQLDMGGVDNSWAGASQRRRVSVRLERRPFEPCAMLKPKSVCMPKPTSRLSLPNLRTRLGGIESPIAEAVRTPPSCPCELHHSLCFSTCDFFHD